MMPIVEPLTDPAQCWHLAEPKLVVTARRIVGHECRGLGITDSLVDDAVLAVDELTTNAVLHGTAPYELRLYQEPLGWGVVDHADGVAVIHAFLSKAGEGCPAMEEFPPSEVGRGLLLVGGLFPGACCVRAAVDGWGRAAKEVAFAIAEAGVHAAADIDSAKRPGGAPPFAGTGQRDR